ncbi:MAG: hypothetical protein ABJG78_13010 [Cyclobacteriaceae bacterium]
MVKRLLAVCVAVLCLTMLQAQVKVGATPTGKHAKAINAAKGAKGQAAERKAQAKRIKEQKRAIKKYETNYGKLKRKRLKDLKRDSVDIRIWSEQDSLAVAEEVLGDLPLEYREIVLNPINLDSLALSYAKDSEYNPETVLESQAKEFLPDELGEAGGSPLEGLPSDPAADGLDTPGVPGVQGMKVPTKPNPNLVKPEAARDLFKKIDPEQFQKVQEDISKLKNKYSSLPDTRFPEEGRKRNSLEDLPFKKRLYFGGNINATSTDPLIMDISLQVGYWINKKWLAGTGLIVREQFNQQDSTSLTGDAYGFSLFMRYDILKQFYAWGESQSQVNRSLLNNESSTPSKWEQATLLGIGRDFSIGPVRMTSLIMYDFNYLNNNLNSRPWVFRLGFQMTKKP